MLLMQDRDNMSLLEDHSNLNSSHMITAILEALMEEDCEILINTCFDFGLNNVFPDTHMPQYMVRFISKLGKDFHIETSSKSYILRVALHTIPPVQNGIGWGVELYRDVLHVMLLNINRVKRLIPPHIFDKFLRPLQFQAEELCRLNS